MKDHELEEDSAWLELVKDIKKIPSRGHAESKPNPVKINVKQGITSFDVERMTESNGLDANTEKRFRKGEFRIEGTLDLHGMTEDKAFDAVNGFIRRAYDRGMRCVLIITGKGLHQGDDEDIFSRRAVLKNKVPEWLEMDGLKPLILSKLHPEAKLGGTGALMILLRRQRD